MAETLTSEMLTRLLASLDADRERAGEKYEELRRILVRLFQWRRAPFPEEQTDQVFDRVARKLGDGVEIRNIGGYCYEVARLVLLEELKGKDSKRTSLDSSHREVAVAEAGEQSHEREARLNCLDDCLDSLPALSRQLIIEYYEPDKGDRIRHRRTLADRLGLPREALANRAQRLRDKLEYCVKQCLRGK